MTNFEDWDPAPSPRELRQERAKQFYTRKDQFERELKKAEAAALKAYISRGRKIRPKPPTARERRMIIEARKGFHGMVNHPTFFLAGEAGSERVNITPRKKSHTSHRDDWEFDFRI